MVLRRLVLCLMVILLRHALPYFLWFHLVRFFHILCVRIISTPNNLIFFSSPHSQTQPVNLRWMGYN